MKKIAITFLIFILIVLFMVALFVIPNAGKILAYICVGTFFGIILFIVFMGIYEVVDEAVDKSNKK